MVGAENQKAFHMAEILIQHAESRHSSGAGTAVKRALSHVPSHSFKYYIHDSVTAFRLQLIGDFRASDVTELSGTWETAKTTLADRRLVLDLFQLHSADEDGHRWLVKMRDTGAASIPASYFESGLQAGGSNSSPVEVSVKLSILGRVLGRVRSSYAAKCR